MRIAYPAAAMATMLLCGLWHGAGVTFIVWGGLHGVFLSLERLFSLRQQGHPHEKAHPRRRAELLRSLAGWTSTQTSRRIRVALLPRREPGPGRVLSWADIVHWQSSELSGRFLAIVLAFGAMLLALDSSSISAGATLYLLRLAAGWRRRRSARRSSSSSPLHGDEQAAAVRLFPVLRLRQR